MASAWNSSPSALHTPCSTYYLGLRTQLVNHPHKS